MFPQVFYRVRHVSLSFLKIATCFLKFSIECHMFPQVFYRVPHVSSSFL